ncbi:hypothetical protein LCGC14_1326740 [marine sediment metagenome]|uniref:Uncharacterized protein n=1 Tax=marine sediment metagenome TaxID=412755 RepID=A0A0F9NK90_9ZZZZ
MAICGVDGCEKAQNDRGICAHHLKLIGQQVEGDQVTWKQYEDAGICIPKKPTTKLCVTKGCGGKANARGLCNNCYAAALRIIEEKGIQWHDLEQVGASLPARRNRSKGPSLFRVNTERLLIKSEQKFIPPIEPAESDQPTIPVTQDQPIVPDVSDEGVKKAINGPEYQFDVPNGKSIPRLQPEWQPDTDSRIFQSTPDDEPNPYQNLLTKENQSEPDKEKSLATEQATKGPSEIVQPFIPPIPASIKGETQEVIVIDDHTYLLTDADLGRLHIQELASGPDDPTCSGTNRLGGIQLPQVDLSHVNAPNPESVKEPATESPNFPAPPTQIP